MPRGAGGVHGAAQASLRSLPENHVVLPCSVADGYLAEFRAEEEAERQAALERKKEQERLDRAALVKDADDLRDNPPPRPIFARPWVTWVALLLIFSTLSLWLWDRLRSSNNRAHHR